MALTRWLVLALLAGCTDDGIIVQPIIDLPMDGDAAPDLLDLITLTVGHAGSPRDLVAHTFARGETLSLPDVPFGDDLVFHMSGFVGTSLTAYGRTCAMQITASGTAVEPHLYFSRSSKFSSLPIEPKLRIKGIGAAYQGGALLVGGSDGAVANQDVELYDPLTAKLTQLGKVDERTDSVWALLGVAPTRVAVLGGVAQNVGAGTVEVIDGRQINRFDFAEIGRVGLTATSLADGRIIAIGGSVPGSNRVSAAIDEIIDNNGTVEARKLQVELAHARSGHSVTRLGGDVGANLLVVGGVDNNNQPIADAELFRPASGTLADPATFVQKLRTPRSGHVAALMSDGSVLIIGGLDASGLPASQIERFTFDGNFAVVATLPPDAGVVDFQATTLPDGRILLTGGRLSPSAAPKQEAFIVRLDQSDGTVDVVQTDQLTVPRAGHQAVLLCDGTVLINGGTSAAGLGAERYNPPPDGRR